MQQRVDLTDIEDNWDELLIPDSSDSGYMLFSHEYHSPERDLWEEVLFQSLYDIGAKPRPGGRRFISPEEWRESRDWLMEPWIDTEEESTKSVHWVLAMLGIADWNGFQIRLRKMRCPECRIIYVEQQCKCHMSSNNEN